MKKFNGTKGECQASKGIFDTNKLMIVCGGGVVCDKVLGQTNDEIEANGVLIVDAFNTIQKCNLLPSELLEQKDELLKVLQGLRSHANITDYDLLRKVDKLINKTLEK